MAIVLFNVNLSFTSISTAGGFNFNSLQFFQRVEADCSNGPTCATWTSTCSYIDDQGDRVSCDDSGVIT